MQYDLEELKPMFKMSTGGLMGTQQKCYYDQDQNPAREGITHYLSTQFNEKLDIKDTCVLVEISLMVISIRKFQHSNDLNDLIQYLMDF